MASRNRSMGLGLSLLSISEIQANPNQTKPKDVRQTMNTNRSFTLPYFEEPKVKVRQQWAGDLAQWRLSHCSGLETILVQSTLQRDVKESSGAICR